MHKDEKSGNHDLSPAPHSRLLAVWLIEKEHIFRERICAYPKDTLKIRPLTPIPLAMSSPRTIIFVSPTTLSSPQNFH